MRCRRSQTQTNCAPLRPWWHALTAEYCKSCGIQRFERGWRGRWSFCSPSSAGADSDAHNVRSPPCQSPTLAPELMPRSVAICLGTQFLHHLLADHLFAKSICFQPTRHCLEVQQSSKSYLTNSEHTFGFMILLWLLWTPAGALRPIGRGF
jgi:hypothetical protein